MPSPYRESPVGQEPENTPPNGVDPEVRVVGNFDDVRGPVLLEPDAQLPLDKRAKNTPSKIGDWVLVHFPQEETGEKRKLSRPWHGPYRVLQHNDPDLTVTKVYFPEERQIQIHR